MGFWRFAVSSVLTDEQKGLLAGIPGVKVAASSASAPENCAWLVGELLSAMGLRYALAAPKRFTPRTAKAALPYLRKWVPEFLTPYQREGPLRILSLPGENGHLWWSAGAGKTLGALIWALAAGTRLTVVVTKAGIRPTWVRQIEEYTQGVEWLVPEGREVTIDLLLPRSDVPRIIVTGYDTLPDWIGTIEKLFPTSVIFDEIHKVKSHKRWTAEVGATPESGASDQAEGRDCILAPSEQSAAPKVTFSLKDNQAAACYRLSRVARRRLATTATPIKDRVRDLWAQLDLINPWEWGSFYPWARRYCAASENTFGGIDTRGKSNLEELKKRCAFVAHRVPYSLANRTLPPKRRLTTYLKVFEQCRPEGGIAAELRAAGRAGPTALLEARLMEAASRKRKVVLAHARDALEGGLKVVIFTGRRKDSERLRDDAQKWESGRISIFHGHGGDSPEAREKTRRSYMAAPGPALLVGTGDAWGEGLDLQDTDLAIFAMLPYTPGQIIQWEGRFARLGQKRPVLIRYLICEGSIDEHVATILLEKLPAVERATDSDEITGLGRELIEASEAELLSSLCEKVLKETGS